MTFNFLTSHSLLLFSISNSSCQEVEKGERNRYRIERDYVSMLILKRTMKVNLLNQIVTKTEISKSSCPGSETPVILPPDTTPIPAFDLKK